VFSDCSIYLCVQALINAHEDWEKRHVKRGWVEAFPVLNELAAEIEEAKKELGAKDLFVRLSSRSPKDAALSHQRIDTLFKAELRYLEDFDRLAQTDEPETLIAMIVLTGPCLPMSLSLSCLSRYCFHIGVQMCVSVLVNSILVDSSSSAALSDLPTQDNRKLHALYRASTVALKTNTGVDAVTLLVESKRIQEDLRRALQRPDEDMPFKVVIREFRQFPVELELRCALFQPSAITIFYRSYYFSLLRVMHGVFHG
jgi:hypothetical protein